jgi:hypothetical protein
MCLKYIISEKKELAAFCLWRRHGGRLTSSGISDFCFVWQYDKPSNNNPIPFALALDKYRLSLHTANKGQIMLKELRRTVDAGRLAQITDVPETMRQGKVNIIILYEPEASIATVNSLALEKIRAIAKNHATIGDKDARKESAGLQLAQIKAKLAATRGEDLAGNECLYREAQILENAINGKYDG